MKMKDNKPYTQYSDPIYTGEKYQKNFLGMSLFQTSGSIAFLVLIVSVREVSREAAIALAAAVVGAAFLLKYIRIRTIRKSTAEGHVNRHGQVTGPCITPEWEQHQSYYKLKCSSCGHSYDVRADRIHRKKCPACQEK